MQDLNKRIQAQWIRKHTDRHMMKRSHGTPDNKYPQLSYQTNQATTDLVFGTSYLIEYPKPIYSDLLSKYLTLRGLGVRNHNIINIKVEKIALLAKHLCSLCTFIFSEKLYQNKLLANLISKRSTQINPNINILQI